MLEYFNLLFFPSKHKPGFSVCPETNQTTSRGEDEYLEGLLETETKEISDKVKKSSNEKRNIKKSKKKINRKQKEKRNNAVYDVH